MTCPSCGVTSRPALEHKLTCLHRQRFWGPPPFITALCPTYHRPKMLATALALWQLQEYDPDRCELLVLDDAGQYPKFQTGQYRYIQDGNAMRVAQCPPYRLISEPVRYPSIPDKYIRMLELMDPRTEAIVLMDDDDIYLPHHLASYAEGFRNYEVVKPKTILSTCGCGYGHATPEPGDGRFYGSLGFTVEAFRNHKPWDGDLQYKLTASLDQQIISRMTKNPDEVYSPPDNPSYIFRWQNTGYPHGQNFIKSPTDTSWYEAFKDKGDATPMKGGIDPCLDHEAELLLAEYRI